MKRHIFIIGIFGILLGGPLWAATADPQSCPSETIINSVRCELDLCLDESPAGVVTDHATIRGHINGIWASGILAYVQNDRSKQVTHINTKKALSADGKFEITVPLPQYGSYTVVIQAIRLIGGPQMISARVARVQKPHDLAASAVLVSEVKPGEDRVSITVDLEKSCREQAKAGVIQNCDLIGSETGATTIEVENRVSSGANVVRRSNSGAVGVYSVCMPLGDGDNVLTIRVCSAAVTPCQELLTQTIPYSKQVPSVNWVHTTPGDLRFRIAHWSPKEDTNTCAGQIELEWNREVVVNPSTGEKTLVQKLCPQNGEYVIDKQPVVGINEMGIRLPGEKGREFRYTFGWGRAVWAKDWIHSVVSMKIGSSVLNRDLPNLLNTFLSSDNFAPLVASLIGLPKPSQPTASESETAVLQRQVRGEIPGCAVGKKSETTMTVIGAPVIGNAYVNDVKLEEGRIATDVTLENLVVRVHYFKDADGDGQPDKSYLPLKIGFKTLRIRPEISIVNKGDKSLVLLTGREDDCLFKGKSYCKHQPAIFQPKDFRGNVDSAGAFVMCDGKSALLSGEMKKNCDSINNVDAKTGLVSLSVLDALNEALYCDASAALTTQLFRSSTKIERSMDVLGRSFKMSMSNRVNSKSLAITPDGIRLDIGSQVDGGGFYYSAVSEGAGLSTPSHQVLGMTIREDLINQVLAVLATAGNPGEGLLDIDLDETVFKFLGFDFTTECSKVPTPTLCNLQPNIQKFFGSDLPMYADDQSLRLKIRGDRVLAPHFSVHRDESGKSILNFDLPNLEIQFLALPKNATEEASPIIAARMTVLLSVTLDAIETDPNDPSQFSLNTHLRIPESHVTIMPVSGSNRTLVPDHVLVGKLRTVLAWGLSEFGKPEKSLPPITIPKSFLLPNAALTESSTSLLSRFGFSEIQLGEGRLQLSVDPITHGLSIATSPILVQTLVKDGTPKTTRWFQ